MAKLTHSVDERVTERAKTYARAAGRPGETPAVLQKLRGSLKRGSTRDYHRYLERKYR